MVNRKFFGKDYQVALAAIAVLFIPIAANADAKGDVNAYETAFEKGDEANGAKLLQQALTNAQSLPIGSAYLAKIAFDNAYYFNQTGDYKTAFAAAAITKKSFDANPKLQAGSNPDDFNLLYAYLQYIADSTPDNVEEHIQNLDNASKKLAKIPQSDTLLLRSNMALDNYYILSWKWREMMDVNVRQDFALKNVTDITPEQKKNFEINYNLRDGQARFLKTTYNVQVPLGGTKLDTNKQIGWEDAYISLLKARMQYGSPTTFMDKDAAEIESWIGIVEAFTNSFFNNTYAARSREKVRQKLNYNGMDYLAKDLYPECIGRFYTDTNFVARDNWKSNYHFTTSTIAFDLDKDLKATNIRVVNALPDSSVAQDAVDNIKTATFKYDGEKPPEKCFKNNIIKVNFYVDNRM